MEKTKPVYVLVRLNVLPQADAHEVVQEMDYSFRGGQIYNTEICGIYEPKPGDPPLDILASPF
jgi:hypothetical protein